MIGTDASVRDTSQAGFSSADRVHETPGADDGRFGFGAFAARYQTENFNGEDTGWRDWSRVFRAWAGRFQRGRVQEIIRSVEARPGDEAIVADLDLQLEEWASAELKSVAADFYHALILFCTGKALKIVLTNKEGEGFEAWRALVNKYEPTSKASVVGKLAEILRTPSDGDFLDSNTTFERKIMIYEAQSRETISDSLKIGCVIAGIGQNSMKEHFLMSATTCDSWTNFVREVLSIEHARKAITAPTPMELMHSKETVTSVGSTDTLRKNVGVRAMKEQREASMCTMWKETPWTVLDTELHIIPQRFTERRMERRQKRKRQGNPERWKVQRRKRRKPWERKRWRKERTTSQRNHRTTRRTVDRWILGTMVRTILEHRSQHCGLA